jgi:hypothetical protein
VSRRASPQWPLAVSQAQKWASPPAAASRAPPP